MSNEPEPREPPAGCQEIPGYIVEVAEGGPWLTQDGYVTAEWPSRGVWPTVEDAAEARERFLERMQ